jgi:ribonucleoside-diphosphate reductase alpha chain
VDNPVGVALSERGPAETVEAEKSAGAGAVDQKELFVRAQRQRLPDERASTTHKFSVGGSEGYITVGMYEDGRPGEVFIKMSKEGSTLSGVMDGLALTLSIGLQYGVPLKVLVDKLINTRFEPSGFTENPQIRIASSLLDYVGRWLGGKFISSSYLKLSTDIDGGVENATPGPVQTTT